MTMDIEQTIRIRRSIRQYDSKAISDATIEELLDLVRHSPSSMDGQPWQFVVVRDSLVKEQIAAAKNAHCPPDKAQFTADFLTHAPVVVAICVDKGRSHHREKENGVLAAATLMLAATDRGLGSVYLSAYQSSDTRLQEDLREILGLPGEIEPVTLIPLGYPAETPGEKAIRPLVEMIRYV